MERSGNPAYRGCGVSERIKKLTEFLTVEDSLQFAAGFFNIPTKDGIFDQHPASSIDLVKATVLCLSA
jgi:hypothetical protein